MSSLPREGKKGKATPSAAETDLAATAQLHLPSHTGQRSSEGSPTYVSSTEPFETLLSRPREEDREEPEGFSATTSPLFHEPHGLCYITFGTTPEDVKASSAGASASTQAKTKDPSHVSGGGAPPKTGSKPQAGASSVSVLTVEGSSAVTLPSTTDGKGTTAQSEPQGLERDSPGNRTPPSRMDTFPSDLEPPPPRNATATPASTSTPTGPSNRAVLQELTNASMFFPGPLNHAHQTASGTPPAATRAGNGSSGTQPNGEQLLDATTMQQREGSHIQVGVDAPFGSPDVQNRVLGTGFFSSVSSLLPQSYSAVPWDMRKPLDYDVRLEQCQCGTISPFAIRRLEYIFRLTLLSVLPACVLAYHPDTTNSWIDPVQLVVLTVLCAEVRVGDSLRKVAQALFAACIYIVLMEIIVAISPAVHYAAWMTVFSMVTLVVAFFTEGMTTKLTLFLFAGRMVTHWNREMKTSPTRATENPHLYVAQFLAPYLVGVGFSLAGSLLPFPRTNAAQADQHLATIYSSISICFHGLCSSLHVPQGNKKRQVNLARIRAVRAGIDSHLVDVKCAFASACIEPWFAKRLVRIEQRIALAERLITYVDTLLVFLQEVAEEPARIDRSVMAQKWLSILSPALVGSCIHVDDACCRLADSTMEYSDEVRKRLERVREKVNEAYNKAREYTYGEEHWNECAEPEKVFPLTLLSFFLFNYGSFYASLASYNADNWEAGTNAPSYLKRIFILFPLKAVIKVRDDVLGLKRGKRWALRRLLEAAKLSFTLSTIIGLLMYLGIQTTFSGAVALALVRDADANASAVYSINSVVAAAVGTLAGFIFASIAQNLAEAITYMCVCALVFGFFKPGDKHKDLGNLSLFYAMTALNPSASIFENGVFIDGARLLAYRQLVYIVQQDVGANLWLAVVHLACFPVWPSQVLQHELHRGVKHLRIAITELSESLITGLPQQLNRVHDEMRVIGDCVQKLKALVPAVAEEPTISRLPFPVPEAKRVLACLVELHATFTPAAVAAQFSLRFQGVEMARPPAERSLAWCIIEGLRSRLTPIVLQLDSLCREIGACLEDDSSVTDPANSLLDRHDRFSTGIQALFDDLVKDFYKSFRTKTVSALYQTPAAIALMQFYRSLDHLMHCLVLAVVEYRRFELLRN